MGETPDVSSRDPYSWAAENAKMFNAQAVESNDARMSLIKLMEAAKLKEAATERENAEARAVAATSAANQRGLVKLRASLRDTDDTAKTIPAGSTMDQLFSSKTPQDLFVNKDQYEKLMEDENKKGRVKDLFGSFDNRGRKRVRIEGLPEAIAAGGVTPTAKVDAGIVNPSGTAMPSAPVTKTIVGPNGQKITIQVDPVTGKPVGR